MIKNSKDVTREAAEVQRTPLKLLQLYDDRIDPIHNTHYLCTRFKIDLDGGRGK